MKFTISFLILILYTHLSFSANLSPPSKDNVSTFQETFQCKNCNLSRIDLSNFSSTNLLKKNPSIPNCSKNLLLSQADLSYAILNKANFIACQRGAISIFRSIDFSYANLAQAQLTDATLYGVSFFYSNLPNTQLIRAKLDISDFTQANFSHARLNQAQSKRDAMHGWGSNFYLANFCGADLSHANLYGYFQGANFSMAKLNNAILSSSNDTIPPHVPHLQKLTGAGLWAGINFKDADLTGAHFYEADNKPADLSQAIFCRTTMPDGVVNNRDCKK